MPRNRETLAAAAKARAGFDTAHANYDTNPTGAAWDAALDAAAPAIDTTDTAVTDGWTPREVTAASLFPDAF